MFEMNNNITEDYCSFEVSKLLKEKGFNKPHRGYNDLGELAPFFDSIEIEYKNNPYFYRPTHALAIKWVRENYGIFLSIFPGSISNTEIGDLKGCTTFYARIDNRWNLAHSNDGKNIPYKDYVAYTQYKSWEEAEEAVLLYSLKHLI